MNYNIKDTDRAYFAGLFDGEGTVDIQKSKSKNRPNESIGYTLRVSFGITYKPIIIKLKKYFGGNTYKRDMDIKKRSKTSKIRIEYENAHPDEWKQEYNYSSTGKEALYFLKVIEPFCDEKKVQVTLGIRFEEGRRPKQGRGGRSTHEQERSEFFHQELKRLKREQPTEDKINNEEELKDKQQNLFSFDNYNR